MVISRPWSLRLWRICIRSRIPCMRRVLELSLSHSSLKVLLLLSLTKSRRDSQMETNAMMKLMLVSI